MKILTVSLTNFGSYTEFTHDYTNSDLSLVYGPVGSGKSTFMDGPLWVLFGITAKGISANSVIPWSLPTSPTAGVVTVELPGQTITVTRVRGSSKENDLWYILDDQDTKRRGKDISETQLLINEVLGVDSYLYTLGSYYNEFSATSQFFTAKASERRQLFESIVDLSLPSQLTESMKDSNKTLKFQIQESKLAVSTLEGQSRQAEKGLLRAQAASEAWIVEQDGFLSKTRQRSEEFEKTKQNQIDSLLNKIDTFHKARILGQESYYKRRDQLYKELELHKNSCPTCGSPNESHAALQQELLDLGYKLKVLKTSESPHDLELIHVSARQNPYNILQEDLINPALATIESHKQDIIDIEADKQIVISDIADLTKKLNDYNQLQSIVDNLRGELIKTRIQAIETETNRYLETYFDSELRVGFTVEGQDKLDVTIHKSGHEAVYKQLSKGQRSILKLCFSVSVMQAASNKAGVHFDNIMMDEALEGFDETLKLKAFNLFSELSKTHSSVTVIDHSEGLQNLFYDKYRVTIDGDISNITKE